MRALKQDLSNFAVDGHVDRMSSHEITEAGDERRIDLASHLSVCCEARGRE